MATDLKAAYMSFEFEPLVATREFHGLQKLLQQYSAAPPIPLSNGSIYFYGDRGQLTTRSFQELAAKGLYYWLARSGQAQNFA